MVFRDCEANDDDDPIYRNFECITRKNQPKIMPKEGVRTIHTYFFVKCAKCSEAYKKWGNI